MTPCYYASTATFFSFPLFLSTALTNKQHKQATQSLCSLLYSTTKVKPETRDPGLLRQAQGTHDEHTTTHTVPAIAIGSVFPYPGIGLVSDPKRRKIVPIAHPSSNCPSHRGVRRTASLARGPAREINRLADVFLTLD